MNGETLEQTNTIKLMKNYDNLTKIYMLKYNDTKTFIHTKQPIAKYISYLRRKKKSDDLLKDLLSKKYETIFIENFSYFSKLEIKNRLIQLQTNKQNKQLNDLLYFESLKKEQTIIPLLNKCFLNSNIVATNRYCPYDYADLNSKYIFELKSNKYSFNEFENAVINYDKIKRIAYPYLVLLFNYDEIGFNKLTKKFQTKLDTYYILYNAFQFESFNKRFIHNNTTGLINNVIDIPTKFLHKINPNTSIALSPI